MEKNMHGGVQCSTVCQMEEAEPTPGIYNEIYGTQVACMASAYNNLLKMVAVA